MSLEIKTNRTGAPLEGVRTRRGGEIKKGGAAAATLERAGAS